MCRSTGGSHRSSLLIVRRVFGADLLIASIPQVVDLVSVLFFSVVVVSVNSMKNFVEYRDEVKLSKAFYTQDINSFVDSLSDLPYSS